jgi:hypothetical protein
MGPFAEPDQVSRQGTGATQGEVLAMPPGDSAVQRDAETAMLSALGTQLGAQLNPHLLRPRDGGHLEVDGFSKDPPILVEA